MKIGIKRKLELELGFIKKCRYRGVSGVFCIGSDKSGPVLGVTICTHGNEVSGLATMAYFRDVFRLDKKLKRGSAIFVLNNIRAAKKYFRSKSEKQRERARFIDVNMNRLPADVMSLRGDRRYEIRRAQELRPVWKEFDFGLDIHSALQRSRAMIISLGRLHRKLIAGFPIRTVISGIEKAQKGRSAASFYGGGKIPVMGIEAGGHEDSGSFRQAISCIKMLLGNLDMLDVARKGKHRYDEYEISDSIIFPDSRYVFAKIFKDFSVIKKGALLASGQKGAVIVAPRDGHTLFAPKGRRPAVIDDEVMFISKPVRKIVL